MLKRYMPINSFDEWVSLFLLLLGQMSAATIAIPMAMHANANDANFICTVLHLLITSNV